MNYNRPNGEKNHYFNNWNFTTILDMFKYDPYTAIDLFEEYTTEYKEDYSMRAYYASSLMTLSRFEEGKKVLDELEKDYKCDKNYMKYKDKVKLLRVNIDYARIKYYFYTNDYEECYKLCKRYKEYMDAQEYDVKRTMFICMKYLDMLDLNRRLPNSYIFSQIVDYHEEDFLNHIKKHTIDDSVSEEEPNDLLFNQSFPVEKVVEETKKYIPSEKALYTGITEDVYFFKYDNCGTFKDTPTDYFKIVAIHGSKDYITMYPFERRIYVPYVDLNYLIEEKPKQKRKTQVDKFNEKYKNY